MKRLCTMQSEFTVYEGFFMKKLKIFFVVIMTMAVLMSVTSCSVFGSRGYSGCTSYNYSRDYYSNNSEYYRGSFTDAYGNYFPGGYYDSYGNFYADDYYNYDYGYYEGYFDPDGYYHENYN